MTDETEFTPPTYLWSGICRARKDGAQGIYCHEYTASVHAEDRDTAVMNFIRQAHADGWEPMFVCVRRIDA